MRISPAADPSESEGHAGTIVGAIALLCLYSCGHSAASAKSATTTTTPTITCTVDGKPLAVEIASASTARQPREGDFVVIEGDVFVWPGGPCQLARLGDIYYVSKAAGELTPESGERTLAWYKEHAPARLYKASHMTNLKGCVKLEGALTVDPQAVCVLVTNQEHMDLLGQLPNLRALHIRGDVSDLRPLGAHQRLVYIDADFSKATVLPDRPMPALRQLSVLQTPISNTAINKFAQTNPLANAWHTYEGEFRSRLAGADRIDIEIANVAEYGGPEGGYFTVRGDAVENLVESIEVIPIATEEHRYLDLDPTIALFFYRQEGLVGHLMASNWAP
jgi:hypothetical protein